MRDGKLDVLVLTEGHPFQSGPFFAMFDADPGLAWLQARHPGAQQFFNPRIADLWDAYVLYDMPGIEFRPGLDPVFSDPPAHVISGFDQLCDNGHGFVFLHHAVASWPTWPGFADALGARFHYAPGRFAGHDWPDSGYRFDTWHRVDVVDPAHPVVAGLGSGFEITDELYLFPVDESRVHPLLRSDYDFSAENFSSSALALHDRRGRRDGWSHPKGSNLIAWTVPYRRTELVYIQCGDGPRAYANPGFRRLLANAIRWVARHRSDAGVDPYPG